MPSITPAVKSMKAAIALMIGVLVFAPWARAGDTADIEKTLAGLLPGKTPDRIVPSPVPGLYEVDFGPQVFYVSKDGHYLLDGDMVDLKERKNLTEQRRTVARVKLINSIDPATMIVFAPKQVKHVVTVFTDVDCPYCRKLHKHLSEYERYGIEIRYLAFPRTGVDTPSYYRAVSVWCAADSNSAITEAEQGKAMPMRHCDNPVDHHLAIAHQIGVTGTPTLVLEDGTMLSGYVSPKELHRLLDGKDVDKKVAD
ncbi:MAG TPA: DsbC family protein [Gammaproteobacteria bacterium]|nr:DsbC family protein [Gammaproteobacteria bacterium]